MALKISRILHAGYIFECENTRVAFDPIFENPFSRNCYAFPSVRFDLEQIRKERFSAVFISHYHDDHCSLESLNILDRETPIYIYCLFDEMLSLIRELGFKNVYPLELDMPVNIGPLEITPRRALDADVDSLFQIRAAGLNVLNVVDSWIDYSTLDLLVKKGPWDLILWPFQTMRELEVLAPSRAEPASLEIPPEWIEQLKTLNPKYIVPSSCQLRMEAWSWYNKAFFPITYKQFQKEVETALPQAKVIRMNPSTSWILSKEGVESAAPLSWVLPVGDQDVDYEYKADLTPQTTAEISRQFGPLTDTQSEKVLEYCRQGLILKYKTLEPPLDPYFKKPCLWQLSIFDHIGSKTSFHYLINGSEIELVPQNSELISWSTEVPMSRLYGALNEGESLTSMYVRINDDMSFDADIMEDPLLRCLFTGIFGAYQTAQLKRIKAQNS